MREATRRLLTCFIAGDASPANGRSEGWTDGTTLMWGREVLAHRTPDGMRIRRPYLPETSRGARELALALFRLFPGAVQGHNNDEVRGTVCESI